MSVPKVPKGIAIVGISCRFPGTANIEAFWRNLMNGAESIRRFTPEELLAVGVSRAAIDDPQYVPAQGALEGIELFDAEFFGMTPREAEITDPQHRIFLECAAEALEAAGYAAGSRAANAVVRTGVYAGCGMSTYLLRNLIANPEVIERLGELSILMANNKDYLPLRASYKLNLRGPSLNVNTACSTSLVAVHLACQALLDFDCDMALAGGAAIQVPQDQGYFYMQDGVLSPDGHCRPFDAGANGTVSGNGAGVVLLKRIEDAIEDGDEIHAVILGSAINNDGADKIGFTAPSIDGQTEVIREALANASIEPGSIGFIETHGTGTAVGDPIEVAALTNVFAEKGTAPKLLSYGGRCALGSVKANIGHLDEAAGIAGLIKAVLAVKHAEIPPTIHYTAPNPALDLSASPFHLSAQSIPWRANAYPRRAGVSSFGLGGTNTHVVIEEPPRYASRTSVDVPSCDDSLPHILPLSARTAGALERMTRNLRDHLSAHPELNLADAAYTLQTGRREFAHRRALTGRAVGEIIELIDARDPSRLISECSDVTNRAVAFVFPGQGSQYVDMARGLYESEATFRDEVDACAEILTQHLGSDIRTILFPSTNGREEAEAKMSEVRWAQPALFVIEYALARLLQHWGIQPSAMIGLSFGEIAAGAVAGVFTREDALAIVAERARLIQSCPRGAMLAVPLPEARVREILPPSLSLAVVTGPAFCVVSGPEGEIELFHRRQTGAGVECRPVPTSHAIHSAMLDPIVDPFTQFVARFPLSAPSIPFLSNITGTWVTKEDATSPAYWGRQLRETVHFSDGLTELFKNPERLLLEVGPGRSASAPILRHPARNPKQPVLNTLRHADDHERDEPFLARVIAGLWARGVEIDWNNFHRGENPRRVPLPTYPFERKRHWIDPPTGAQTPTVRKSDIADWFHVPSWRRAPRSIRYCEPVESEISSRFADPGRLLKDSTQSSHCERTGAPGSEEFSLFIIAEPDCPLATELAAEFRNRNLSVEILPLFVRAGFPRPAFNLAPRSHPTFIHLSGFSAPSTTAQILDSAFHSLFAFIQSLIHDTPDRELDLIAVTTSAFDVTGDEKILPANAALLGPLFVASQEYPSIRSRAIDLIRAPGDVARLADEILASSADRIVALRGPHRWVRDYAPLRLEKGADKPLREKGVYLITGGLGGVGLILADLLARECRARLVLVARSEFPDRARWLELAQSDHVHTHRIRALLTIESAGAELLILRADVADESAMCDVIITTHKRFGPINGVIHAAGITSSDLVFNPLAETTRANADAVLRPKIAGTESLDTALADEPLDFAVLVSSNAATLGGIGFAAYSAASHFLDAFAESKPTRWQSVNWDGWPSEEALGEATAAQSALDRFAMTRHESEEAFLRALSSYEPRLIVSASDLPARLDRWMATSDLASSVRAGSPRPVSENASTLSLTDSATDPSLTETESRITALWRDLLGVTSIAPHQTFFDLGGDSLLGSRLIARINRDFALERAGSRLSVRALFEDPTVARLSARIDTLRTPAPAGVEEEEGVL